MPLKNYEKLGAFYLGKTYDLDRSALTDETLLYDAKDLTTHAVCVGMTGSGKTGLCVTLIEEAAIDGIPAIVVDLKGDLVNLMLAFPEMRPEDLLPWIEPAEATRKGMSVDDYARKQAKVWREGLAAWDQDLDRIARYRDSVDLSVYTPGSSNGRPLTILRSFAAPPAELLADSEALQGRISGSVSGLLALLGIQADPVTSREFILLATILQQAWAEGRDVDLGALIQQIQKPPFERVGFFALDTFFPAAERLGLAMRVNNLLASPGFASWLTGEPLDVGRLLWTPAGKPRISILSLAHLDDAARMFFMTTLLNEVNAWMRTQPGSSSLRALLYIDEVFGYLPPTANPPSKIPMLTLLKQARAFGLGLVLATQNPVDLDYKALSNAGTWLIGRLQTERDKMRVLDGLEGAAGSNGSVFDRARMEKVLAGLDSRVFVMNNVHDDGPVVFHSRWALSYLRGPVTGAQIRDLNRAGNEARLEQRAQQAPNAAPTELKAKEKQGGQKDALPVGVEERFVVPNRRPRGDERIVYRPAIFGRASLHYVSAAAGIDSWQEASLLGLITQGQAADPWSESLATGDLELEAQNDGTAAISFEKLPATARRAESFKSWEKNLKNHLHRERPLLSWKCPSLKLTARPGEIEGDFRARVKAAADEKRDLEMEKLKIKYAKKIETMRGKLDRAEDKIEREEAQYSQQKTSTVISLGSTLLGALFGRKTASIGNVGRAASSLRGASRAARERGDVQRAKEDAAELEQELKDLEAEFAESLAETQAKLAAADLDVVAVPIALRKTDFQVLDFGFVWAPWIVSASGLAEPAFSIDG